MKLQLLDKKTHLLDHMWLRILICFLAPIFLFGILLVSQGISPILAYKTIVTSVFGSTYTIGEVVVRATYLILTAMAAILPARVGLANAGGEGQMTIAATAVAVAGSTIFAEVPAVIAVPLLFVVGMLAGAAWAGIAVICKQLLNMNEILCTILLNYIAEYVICFLLYGVLKDPHGWNYPQTVEVASHLRLPRYFGTRVTFGIFIALAVAILVWVVLYKTRVGFTMRTVGGNQTAARFSGVRLKRVQSLVFAASGAIAGIAGTILILGVEGRMRTDAGATMGFMGFLTAGMVGNSPIWAIPSALLIGALDVAGNGVEIATGLPAATMQILIMLVLLTIMAVGGKKKHE
ncbi:MAG: ABC transporter permease [Clostridia bacterium]|nr:ABC transporter permease [Clostridia bacterium]